MPTRVYRHRWPTRIWHWLNAVTLLVMLMSGLMIFNAYPRLHWGAYGAINDPAWMEIRSTATDGYLRVGSVEVKTTGVYWATGPMPRARPSAGPSPIGPPIPSGYSLADGRRWHLLFAWVLAISMTLYMVWSLCARHISRDLHVTQSEWSPRHIWHDIKGHARLRFPTGEAAARYNVLQKLGLYQRYLCHAAADDFDWPGHVAGVQRHCAVDMWTCSVAGSRRARFTSL